MTASIFARTIWLAGTAAFEAAPKQKCGGQQIKDLHQRLRHQPRIPDEKRPLLLSQCASRLGGAKARRPTMLARDGGRDAGGGNGMIAEPRRENHDRDAE